ncbi:hypothetical protein GJAV_G00179830 [Gymnothorax javanicus]|nr:hypothetical protein GJAV_G00179830 [Gymnothorax javanicus]
MPSEWGLSASPPLKPKPESWLSSLGHEANCPCPCCTDPALGRVVVRWAAARAELTRRLCQVGAEKRSRRLFLTALSRSKSATSKLGARLVRLTGASDKTETSPPSFLHDLTARIHLRMALSSLEPQAGIGGCSWELLESGLAFVGSRSSPELAFVRAGLQAAKALMSILALASKRGCRPEELFSPRWTWNPSAASKTEPLPVTKKTKESNPLETKKVRELANGATAVPKLKVVLPSSKGKSTKAAAGPKPACTPREGACAFDFDDEVPQIAMCTPAQKVRSTRSARCGAAKSAPKLQFQVYDESSPAQDELKPVPAAPKRGKRSRFKVEFSDDSDAEAEAPVPAGVAPSKTTTSASKPASRTSAQTPASSTAASKASARATTKTLGPRKQGRPKKSTAPPVDGSSSEESAPRRGRPRKPTPAACEEPERMRTIKEEAEREAWLHDTSVEVLRASDSEEQAGLQDVPDKDLEVLRREPALHQPMEGLGIIRAGVHSATLPSHLAHPNAGLAGSLSLDAVEGLLQGALESLHHLPPPGLFPQLCSLLALCVGQSDPESTALLHAQALGLTARHDMNRHLCSRLTKLRKAAAPDLSAQLNGLSLDASPAQSPLLHRLSRLQSCFSFPALEPGSFPSLLKQQLSQQLQSIPAGVTVCLLSLVGAQVGEVGDTILLSRLERGCISPAPISAVLQEMDCVQREQKVVSSVADKAQWWAGRRALDQRMQRLLEQMRDILGCWQGLLLPLTSDPELLVQARALPLRLSEYGAKTTQETLQAVLSASPLLSAADLLSLAGGLCAGRASNALAALQEAVSALKNRTEPQGHTVLLLDKFLQKLPWENISCLRCRSVTRMPSLHFLLGHCALRELDPDSVLNCRVDPQQVYYVLNPDASLKDTEGCFKEWFTSESAWQGVCGAAPPTDALQQAVATKDLYIYVGHGAGARFLDSRRLLSQELRAAALLFGCSSAALAVHGELEGAGVILNYLMAGCPLVLGNLWDVTDRDIDRFTKALLQSWLSARGTGLLDHMNSSRQATYLKHLIGAAPVVYGLPVYLK